jgi:hypothetical protein
MREAATSTERVTRPGEASDTPRRGVRLPRHPAAWLAFYLLAIDVAANLFFAYPSDPRNTSPSKMRRYFEYGRSVEGKLDRMTRRTNAESAPILAAGWLPAGRTAPDAGPAGRATKPVVTLYGMSHANLLAEEMARGDETVQIRSRAAPLGTPTWAYTAYLRDRERVRSDVAILTVMTETIPLLSATSGGTMYFDGAYPYTWPRYYLVDGTLRSVAPPFLSVEGYREHFYDEGRWSAYRRWLEAHDSYYDPLLFRRSVLDGSSLLRLLRRSYAFATRARKKAAVYDDARGFDASSEEVRLLDAIVADFARSARREGTRPIVFVVNNLNTGARAFELLRPTLERDRVPCLSSHELCPPDEPRNYLPDSHFTPAKNAELARAMVDLVHRELAAR